MKCADGIEVPLESEGWFDNWWGDSAPAFNANSQLAAEISHSLVADRSKRRRKLVLGVALAIVAVAGILVAAAVISKGVRSSSNSENASQGTASGLTNSFDYGRNSGMSGDVSGDVTDDASGDTSIDNDYSDVYYSDAFPGPTSPTFEESIVFEDSVSTDQLPETESTMSGPTSLPTEQPSAEPTTGKPTPSPTTGKPTRNPTPSPTQAPTDAPTPSPTTTMRPTPDKPPNVLFLYSDQHQAAATGYEGHPDVLTPNLDKLASQGTRFSRAYINNGICASSRESMMSGLHPRTLGVLDNPDQSRTKVSEEVKTMASTFRDNGYATAAIGKRHLSYEEDGQLDAGWDVRKSHRYRTDKENTYIQWLIEQGTNPVSGRPFVQEFADDNAACDGKGPRGGELSDLGDFGRAYIPEQGKADLCTRTSKLPANYTMEAWTTQETIKYIKNRDRQKPFFLWSTFYRPHQPYNPLQKYLDMYSKEGGKNWSREWGEGRRNGGAIKKPLNLEQDVNSLPPVLANVRQREDRIWNCGTAARNHQIYRDYMAGYYALITEVDYHVGEILKTLEDEGLLENTIVVYTSDHGEFAGRHGLVSKQSGGHTLYEEVYRVPFIMRWPNHIKENREETSLTEAVDIYPTLMDLVGIDDKAQDGFPLQGKSLVPTLTEGTPTGTEYIIAENWYAITIITENYKLSRWYTGPDLRKEFKNRDWSGFGNLLYDRRYDPSEGPSFPLETQNLYEDEEYILVRNELEAKIDQWIVSTSSAGRDEWMTMYSS